MFSYLFAGRRQLGVQLLLQLVQLLPEEHLLLLQSEALFLKLLLQLLQSRNIRVTNRLHTHTHTLPPPAFYLFADATC